MRRYVVLLYYFYSRCYISRGNVHSSKIRTTYSRAVHWLTQSVVAIILSSESISILDCSSMLLSLVPTHFLSKRIEWVSVLKYGVFLGRTYKIKTTGASHVNQ